MVLRGYDAVKEALVDQAEDFGGRGKELMFDWIFQGYGEHQGRLVHCGSLGSFRRVGWSRAWLSKNPGGLAATQLGLPRGVPSPSQHLPFSWPSSFEAPAPILSSLRVSLLPNQGFHFVMGNEPNSCALSPS